MKESRMKASQPVRRFHSTRLYFIFGLIILLAASCVKERVVEDVRVVPAGQLSIEAASSSLTRTILNSKNDILWLNTDLLYVFNPENKATLFSTTDNDVREATFSTDSWPGGEPRYAVHLNPDYNEKYELTSPGEGILPVKFRSVQNVIWKGTFARQASASVGKAEYREGRYVIGGMKNVMSVLSFRIEGTDVEKVIAKAIGNEVMAGWVWVDYGKLVGGDADFWTPMEEKSQSSTITLTPGGSVVEDSCFKPGTYYMSLLPQTYAQGIELSIYSKGSSNPVVRTIGTKGGVVFKRNEIRPINTGVDDPLPATVTIDLAFYNEDNVNPLGFQDLTADKESTKGETYNYTFNYEYNGNPASREFPIVICKGAASGARYHYKEYDLVWPSGTRGSVLVFDQANGWMIAPAIPGRVLQSVIYEHGNAYAKQMVIKEILDPENPKLGDATTIAYTSKLTPVASAEGPSSDRISFYSNGFEGTNVTANTKSGKPYFLQFTGNNGTRVYHIKLVYTPTLPELPNFDPKVSDFPQVIIHTDGERPVVDKETKVRGYIQYKDAKGMYPAPTEIADSMTISGRGNTTWTKFPKKPYKFTLDNKTKFFGLDKDKKWVLLANHSDKSLLRNMLAMKISSILGFDWTPAMYPAEVWFNGDYLGLYTISEHKKVSSGRVDIDTDAGDMYLEVDLLMDETTCFETDIMRVPIMFSDPEEPTPVQLEETKAYFKEFEQVLLSDSFADPQDGYAKYVDVPSFVNFYIIQELSKNCDGHLSKGAFITRTAADPRLKMYHVWDFDIAFGNCNYLTDIKGMNNGPEGFLIKDVGPHGRDTGWICKMFNDPVFVSLVKARWTEVYPQLSALGAFIDQAAAAQKEAAARNFQRWPVLGRYLWPNVSWPATYDEEVANLKAFYIARLEWLNENLPAL